jgi:hypothetical protein
MFRFTIRDVLWFTVMVALVVGWWVDRGRLAGKARESRTWEFRATVMADQIRFDGGYVSWTDNTISGGNGKGGHWGVQEGGSSQPALSAP